MFINNNWPGDKRVETCYFHKDHIRSNMVPWTGH